MGLKLDIRLRLVSIFARGAANIQKDQELTISSSLHLDSARIGVSLVTHMENIPMMVLTRVRKVFHSH